jgi:hypothetical protein
MSSEWFGVCRRHLYIRLAAAAFALHAAACGGNTSVEAARPDSAGGSGAQGGSAGLGGGLVEPRCDTRDDGAEVLADNLVGVRDPRLDATHLYHPLHEEIGPGVFVTRIYKMALAAGAPLEELWTRDGTIHGFVLSEQYLWWAHSPPLDVERLREEMTLYRVAKAGGSAEVMLTGYVQGLASSPQGLVIRRVNEKLEGDSGTFQLLPWSGGVPRDLCEYDGLGYAAANATVVAWTHHQGIETCPLTGGPASPLGVLGATEAAVALAVDSTHAFLSTFDAIYRVPLAGGEREPIVPHPDPGSPLYPLVLDGEEIFVRRAPSRILRVPKTGGTPRDAIPPQSGVVTFFTIDATHIYWGEGYPIACLKRKLK